VYGLFAEGVCAVKRPSTMCGAIVRRVSHPTPTADDPGKSKKVSGTSASFVRVAPVGARSVGTQQRGRRVLALVAGLVAGCALIRGREPTITETLRTRQLMVPVAGVSPDEVLANFEAPRGGGRIHGAVDIPAPRGTPVLSADDGRVLRLHRNRKGGLTIYATDATERFVYYYAHLEAYGRGVAKGTPLARGQVIGFVGTTGNADRREPHLHFQVMVRPRDGRQWSGEPIDPRPFFASRGRAR
jgi:murein DD-endopeptidase MepM/ murein hydrolase activator NlpD